MQAPYSTIDGLVQARRIDLNPCFGQIPLEQTLLSLKAEIRTCRCGMAEW